MGFSRDPNAGGGVDVGVAVAAAVVATGVGLALSSAGVGVTVLAVGGTGVGEGTAAAGTTVRAAIGAGDWVGFWAGTTTPGGSTLEPVQVTMPSSVRARWLKPSVNVGVFVLLR